MPAHDPARDAAFDAVRRGFYGNELPAAVRAGQALLDTIDPASPDAGEQAARARVLLWLVRCARRADEPNTALAHAYAGMAAAQAAADSRLECRLRAQYVHVLASLGQNVTALDEGYKVLRRAADSGDTLAQAACWLALGDVHWAMQQWRDGEQAYTEALRLAGLCGEMEICGLASNGIAAMEDHYATQARTAGRAEASLVHASRSLALLEDFTRISQEIGDTYNAWIGRHNQACCRFGMGEHDSARALLEAELSLLGEERGSRRQLTLQMLGEVHLAQGRPALAIACETEALEIAEQLALPLLAMDACRLLVTALEHIGNFREALAQHRRFHAFYVQLASNRSQAHARAMAVIYETEKTQVLAEAQRKRADRLASANSSLAQENAALERSSMEDALTGLANRRRFDQVLQQALGGDAPPAGSALALIDVDHFKRVNDTFSHQVGDEVLRRLGALLQRDCRKQDLAARYGGEEFALILAGADPATARAACERLRAAVETEPWQALQAGLRVTVSIGVVHVDEAQVDGKVTRLLAIADARLYAAKRGGRNRVVDAAG